MRAGAIRTPDRRKDFQPRRSATKPGGRMKQKVPPTENVSTALFNRPRNYPGQKNIADKRRGESYKRQCLKMSNFVSFTRPEWDKIRILRSAEKIYHPARAKSQKPPGARYYKKFFPRGIAVPPGERSAFYPRLSSHFLMVSAVRRVWVQFPLLGQSLQPAGHTARAERPASRSTARREMRPARSVKLRPEGDRRHARGAPRTFPGVLLLDIKDNIS